MPFCSMRSAYSLSKVWLSAINRSTSLEGSASPLLQLPKRLMLEIVSRVFKFLTSLSKGFRIFSGSLIIAFPSGGSLSLVCGSFSVISMLKFYSKSFVVIFMGESIDLYIKSWKKNGYNGPEERFLIPSVLMKNH